VEDEEESKQLSRNDTIIKLELRRSKEVEVTF